MYGFQSQIIVVFNLLITINLYPVYFVEIVNFKHLKKNFSNSTVQINSRKLIFIHALPSSGIFQLKYDKIFEVMIQQILNEYEFKLHNNSIKLQITIAV